MSDEPRAPRAASESAPRAAGFSPRESGNSKRAAGFSPRESGNPKQPADSHNAASSRPREETALDPRLPDILCTSRTRVVFGKGKLAELGAIAKQEGASTVLLVTDPGIVAAGHVERAVDSLHRSGLSVVVFDGVEENPTTHHVESAVRLARRHGIDFLVGLGGGSSMDCAKGVNFILTGGGTMADYWGIHQPLGAMLAMIAVPTTAGTGSEAQSFALISDPVTHRKMACGDPQAACRVAILDPDLTLTQPRSVAGASGIDAVSHAVETAGTTKRNEISLEFTRQAWQRLEAAFDQAILQPHDEAVRCDMLLGAHLAGAAIEHSMLGAAHALANPLTARWGIVHGVAVGMMLPHVVRFNSQGDWNPYSALCDDADQLARRVESMLKLADLPQRLADCSVPESVLPELSREAAEQWTARFNPRPFGAAESLQVYRSAL